MRTILVCGGRSYNDYDKFCEVMRSVVRDAEGDDLRIVEGGADGADALAEYWAREHSYELVTYAADWKGEGRSAGPRRNQRMLDSETVSLVVAFPGGRGTADMVRRAKAKGVRVLEIASLLVIALMFAACVAPPVVPPDVPTDVETPVDASDLMHLGAPVTAEALFTPTTMKSITAAVAPGPAVRGVIRRIGGGSPCVTTSGVVPYVYFDNHEPQADKLLRIQWTTRAMRPFPDEPMALLVSTDTTFQPLDLSPFGHLGCWLVVAPTWILAPEPGSFLFKPEPGVIELAWPLPRAFVGMTWRAQLVVQTTDTPSGFAVSPGVEFLIGSSEGL